MDRKVFMGAFLILMLFFSQLSVYSAGNNENNKKLQDIREINITSTDNSISINWESEFSKFYTIHNERGELMYQGSGESFIQEDLDSNKFYTYYLTVIDVNGKLLYNRASITIRTKKDNGEDKGFNYVISTEKSITFDWSPIKGAETYEVYKNGQLIKNLNSTFFKDEFNKREENEYNIRTVVKEKKLKDDSEEEELSKEYNFQINIDTNRVSNESIVTTLGYEDNVQIIFKTFIPYDKVRDPWMDDTHCVWYFGGDGNNRPFSYSDNRYRTYQEVNIDFSLQDYSYYEKIGLTERWCENTAGSKFNYDSDYANMDQSYVSQNFVWGENTVDFFLALHSANPFIPVAPAINAEITFTIYKGSGTVTGTTVADMDHDGFPAYEIWRKDGDLSPKAVYTFHPADENQTIYSLGPPMEFHPYIVN